jgi:uncharacterized protein
MARKRVAVIGSGIAGLAAADALRQAAHVTLFEADGRFGGHAHTVDVTLDGVTHGVDTGFLVFNHRTYPQLVHLFDDLKVRTAASEMSFSVQDRAQDLEWSGCSLNSVFSQRRNLLSPRFLGMLRDILRFNRLATGLAEQRADQGLDQSISDFLDEHRFGRGFRDGYLLPMLGCIWSCPTDQMLQFPVATMIRFCHNHGLVQITDRPQWHTVQGGSRQYVRAMLKRLLSSGADCRLDTPVRGVRRLPPGQGHAGVTVRTDHGTERFDDVVLACHSDQSLALLDDAEPIEQAVLGAIRYQPNRAVLHTDDSLLPRRRRAWAAWNYERAADAAREQSSVCLHYLINRLQPLPWQRPVIVSLNPAREPQPHHVISSHAYSHPVFDGAAMRAQQRVTDLQGRSHLWFAGAWTRYGFHEDGLMSGQAVGQALVARWASQTTADAA